MGIILARSLLWAAHEKEVRTNNQVLSIILSDLGARIKAACGGGDVNPIEKVGLLVSQRMDQLEIFPVSGNNDHDGGGGNSGGGGTLGQNVTDLSCQIFRLKQIVGDMRKEVNSLFCDQRRHINTLNTNVKRIALVPGVRGGAAAERPRRTANEQRRVRLSKCQRDLWVLWREWEQGLGDGKPAKAFTLAKWGANKFSFSRRKVFWDTVEEMVKRGNTSDNSIDKLYWVYGWNNSVTTILIEMRRDKKRGVKRV